MTTGEEIKGYLDIIGTFGTLTVGFMPDTTGAIGTIYEYGGQQDDPRFGIPGIGYEKPAIQVAFRGVAFDYFGPRVKAESAYRLLAAIQPGVLPGTGFPTKYNMIRPQQPPHPVKEMDTKNRHTIGVNFYIDKEATA